MAKLELKGVKKSFGATDVIGGIDLAIEDGEFCVFVGPSGCGKSTLLRIIAGLEEVSDGELLIDGLDVTDMSPAKRGIAMVFQSYALYPQMSVAENMGFGLKMAKYDAKEIERRVKLAAQKLKMEHLLARKPRELSGGQRQRVAIGRAIVREPKLFLFDEPLSNLDAALRVEMRIELAKLKAELGTTFIYVTHDQVEAMTLADKIVVLKDGVIEQVGTPMDLYHRPHNQFVAGFIGSPKMNFLSGNLLSTDRDACEIGLSGGAKIRLEYPVGRYIDGQVTLGIRPEHIEQVPLERATIRGTILVTERLGGETYVQIDTESIMVKLDGNATCRNGEEIGLYFPPERCHLFDADKSTSMLATINKRPQCSSNCARL